ncbi:MAG: hypothetical protein NVSMB56_05550 [Pyrinomonadaceae bacterium]
MSSKKRTSAKDSKKGDASEAAGKMTVAGATVACWEDDPGDPQLQPPPAPITVAAPNQAAQPLPFKIGGATPAPKIYQPGTPNFRFYAAASALRRTANFWGAIIQSGTNWEVGKTLPVILDDGVDLNAFYTRGGFGDAPGLHFFHQGIAGRVYFSGESPDVVCHEMGHAVLDAIRPQLFDAQTIEAAAFHESFGDMSAMLSALQVVSFRQAVFNETQGVINRASRLSRLAEQLGAAIRIQHPDAVDADCLRNAANSFFYRDPQTLPPSAPASQLSSEPHSFSRVFTGAFLDALAGMFKLQGASPTAADLLKTSQDMGRILIAGILAAPVVPDYYSQVAAHMIDADEAAPFSGKYRDALKSAFVRRGILSLHAAATITSVKPVGARRISMTGRSDSASGELPKATISGSQYGLKKAALMVYTAEEPKRFAVTSASLTLGSIEPRSPQNSAESFTEDLFQRGRVDIGSYGHSETAHVHSLSRKTHVIVEESGDLLLKRRTFDCGFD